MTFKISRSELIKSKGNIDTQSSVKDAKLDDKTKSSIAQVILNINDNGGNDDKHQYFA